MAVPDWIPDQVRGGRDWQQVGTNRYQATAVDEPGELLYLATTSAGGGYALLRVPAGAGPHTVATVWMRLERQAADPALSIKRD